MLKLGDHIGRYEVQSIVGTGGFGQVYRAWDPELGRPVAIKELAHERKEDEPAKYAEYRERFKLERRVQGQFQHPYIISVYDLVQQDDNEYLIEEFVEGGSLRACLDLEGRLPAQRVIQIGLEMCQAIAVMWEHDVVHRDIKPSNILLTGDGHVKLGDFGVAQIGRLSQRTQSNIHHPGTPAYMSPEQERGNGYLDERSDFYSLGLVLYEALTGRSYKRERVPVCQLAPDVPKRLEQVVMRALSQDPDVRYQSTAEFARSLQRVREKTRPAWQWWASGVVLLALIASGWLIFQSFPRHPALPVPTVALTPIQMPLAIPPASTKTPDELIPVTTRTPVFTPTAVFSPSATPTPTATVAQSIPTRSPISVASPQLLSPPGAGHICLTPFVFKWDGRLPNAGFGYRVSLRNNERSLSYTSPLLEGTQWAADVPGSAVGEWVWSVAVVRRNETQDVVVRSDERTFYFTPFCPPVSPIGTP